MRITKFVLNLVTRFKIILAPIHTQRIKEIKYVWWFIYVATWLGHNAQWLGQALGPSRFWAKQIKSIDFESSRLPSKMWVGLIQSVEGLTRKDWGSPEKERIVPPDCLWAHDCDTISSLGLQPANMPDSPYNCVSQFLKSLSLPISRWMDGGTDGYRQMDERMDG